MNDEELKKAQTANGDIVEIPSVAGAVVLAFNLPGFTGDLNLSGPVIADIYLGKITKWNDPAIAALNPGRRCPIRTSRPFTAATAAAPILSSPAISVPKAMIFKRA